MTKVVHCNKESYDYYIGRPSIYGNPFSHLNGTLARFKVSSRDEAVDRFEEYCLNRMEQDEHFRNAVYLLRGLTIGCWCKPKRCHGDIYVKILDSQPMLF